MSDIKRIFQGFEQFSEDIENSIHDVEASMPEIKTKETDWVGVAEAITKSSAEIAVNYNKGKAQDILNKYKAATESQKKLMQGMNPYQRQEFMASKEFNSPAKMAQEELGKINSHIAKPFLSLISSDISNRAAETIALASQESFRRTKSDINGLKKSYRNAVKVGDKQAADNLATQIATLAATQGKAYYKNVFKELQNETVQAEMSYILGDASDNLKPEIRNKKLKELLKNPSSLKNLSKKDIKKLREYVSTGTITAEFKSRYVTNQFNRILQGVEPDKRYSRVYEAFKNAAKDGGRVDARSARKILGIPESGNLSDRQVEEIKALEETIKKFNNKINSGEAPNISKSFGLNPAIDEETISSIEKTLNDASNNSTGLKEALSAVPVGQMQSYVEIKKKRLGRLPEKERFKEELKLSMLVDSMNRGQTGVIGDTDSVLFSAGVKATEGLTSTAREQLFSDRPEAGFFGNLLNIFTTTTSEKAQALSKEAYDTAVTQALGEASKTEGFNKLSAAEKVERVKEYLDPYVDSAYDRSREIGTGSNDLGTGGSNLEVYDPKVAQIVSKFAATNNINKLNELLKTKPKLNAELGRGFMNVNASTLLNAEKPQAGFFLKKEGGSNKLFVSYRTPSGTLVEVEALNKEGNEITFSNLDISNGFASKHLYPDAKDMEIVQEDAVRFDPRTPAGNIGNFNLGTNEGTIADSVKLQIGEDAKGLFPDGSSDNADKLIDIFGNLELGSGRYNQDKGNWNKLKDVVGDKNIGGSHGPLQIRLSTAKNLLKIYEGKDLSDDEVKKQLSDEGRYYKIFNYAIRDFKVHVDRTVASVEAEGLKPTPKDKLLLLMAFYNGGLKMFRKSKAKILKQIMAGEPINPRKDGKVTEGVSNVRKYLGRGRSLIDKFNQ